MEPQIRHVRFFNGQFLKQEEFREDQTYTIHMRRRVNYVLFENGVLPVTNADLTIVPETADPNDKRIRIKRGMAVGANHDVFESKEIIQRDDSQIFDLSANFGAGQTVWVTVNYLETESVPVALGPATENSRVDETAEIRFHSANPTGTLTPNGDPLIVLGAVTFDTMAVSTADRQMATLRSGLGGGPGGGATLVSIAILPAGPLALTTGGTQALSAQGTFSDASTAPLGPADGLTWNSSAPGIATVNAGGLVTAVAPGAATVTAAVGAVTQTANVTVSAPVPQPDIQTPSPSAATGQATGGVVDLMGFNLRDPLLAPNVPAVGTTVRLIKGPNIKDALNVVTRLDIAGQQVVRFTMPNRTGTPWLEQETVTIELQFGGGTATEPYKYDD